MGKFVLFANCSLHENFGEIASHEGIKIGENLATGEIVASKKCKRDNNFQEPLLVVHMVADAVESC